MHLLGVAICCIGASIASGAVPDFIEIGSPSLPSKVPAWNASGPLEMPWQEIATIDLTPDGRFAAAGTIAPLGDPNVFKFDERGRLVEQYAVHLRFINEVAVSGDGTTLAAVCTSPTGNSEDPPQAYLFAPGGERGSRIEGYSPLLFQYGDHSNHYGRSLCATADGIAITLPESFGWDASRVGKSQKSTTRYGAGTGRISCVALSPSGRSVLGFVTSQSERKATSVSLVTLDRGQTLPTWQRAVSDSQDVEPAAILSEGRYGPRTRIADEKLWGPLAIALDRDGETIASADYQGWERFVISRGPGDDLRPPRSLGVRFSAERPTVHVYNADGKLIRTFGPEAFAHPIWCDLAFSPNGNELLAFPHHWTSRGLAGQPFLPADDEARELYVLSIRDGVVRRLRFPDRISDVAIGGDRAAIGCWNGRTYILGKSFQPLPALPDGVALGGPALLRASKDGKRFLAATAAGVVIMLDEAGHELWNTDLGKTARHGEKPWTIDRVPDHIGPGVWRINTGRFASDLGNQIVIEAPDGLLLVDPNSGHSFEQNLAAMRGAGLDPMRVKYILTTHEHGDHAPGSYLWRVMTGAKVIASPEMAYTLQHDLPYTSGYGFHPPIPVDITVDHDQDMMLSGLKMRALRLPGHTYGSMGWAFELHGRRYVCTGDLIMEGGILGYAGSVNFWAADVLASLKKVADQKPDVVLGGHGRGDPDRFSGAGIRAGEATGWGQMAPLKPDPFYGFADRKYQAVAWLQHIDSADFGDIDGDGLPDVAVLTSSSKELAVKIYLNKKGRFDAEPDRVIDVPDVYPGFKLRIAHLSAGKIADFLVSSESSAALLVSDGQTMNWEVVPLELTRAATISVDPIIGSAEAGIVGERFVSGCRILQHTPAGVWKTIDGPRTARNYLEMQLRDINGDGHSDLVTSSGEIFLRLPDGKLPQTASLTLERPFGEWTFLAIGDFNGDGRPDIVQLGTDSDHVKAAVFYNTGDSAHPFHEKPDDILDLGTGFGPIRDGPTVGDFIGDGIDDLVVGAGQGKQVLILPGSKTGGLDSRRIIHVMLDYRIHYDTKLAVLDLDGNGKKALAGFGFSDVGAGGVYIRLPGADSATQRAP